MLKRILILAALMLSTLSYAAVEKEWTFLVFLNGDNNLNSYGDKDVKEMMGVGSNDNLNVVVLRDFGTRQSTKILYVNKGSTTTAYDYGTNVDTGDYRTLVDFFSYSVKKYPAKKYAVVVWDHGAGWMDKAKRETISGISYDDSSGNHISTEQLGVALEEMKKTNGGKNIDILAADACLMAMAEVIYEVKDSVDFFVGSEETEPGNGWDYVGALSPLSNRSMTPEALSASLVTAYIKSYPSNPVTQSAVNVSKFVEAVDSVNAFVSESARIFQSNKPAIKAAVVESQYFAESSYKDYLHFLNLVYNKVNDQDFRNATKVLSDNLKRSIVLSGNNQMPNALGISVWIPSSPYALSSYKKLKWSEDTSWDSFIEMFIK